MITETCKNTLHSHVYCKNNKNQLFQNEELELC